MSKEKIVLDAKALATELYSNVKVVHFNVSQEVIVTTEDKVRLCLMGHLQYVEKRRAWTTPLGILLTVLVTLVTTTFKDIGLSSYTWQAIFMMAAILALFWLALSAIQARKTKKVEDLVRELKKSSPLEQTSPD